MPISWVPLLGIWVADYFVLRGRHYDLTELYHIGGSYWYCSGVNWLAIGVWFAGFLLYLFIAGVPQLGLEGWAPWLGATLPSFFFGFVVYVLVGRLALKQPVVPSLPWGYTRRAAAHSCCGPHKNCEMPFLLGTQLVGEPLQILPAASDNWHGDDFWCFVAMQLFNRLLEPTIKTPLTLDYAQPFFGPLDLTLPPKRADDGSEDLDTASHSLFNQCIGDLLRVLTGRGRRHHLEIFVHHTTPASRYREAW